jgi:SAM-dependent methyltransferase
VGRGNGRQREPPRRAAGYDGYFPANLEHPDQLAEIVATFTELRQYTTARYDVVVGLPVGVDPLPYVEAGATWWLPEFPPRGGIPRHGAGCAPRWPADAMTVPNVGDVNFYDAELRRHNVAFRAAADVRPGDHVLDIGCGAGQTTRDAARAAVNGSALGVDVSARMLERARRIAEAEGLRNVTFEHGDAQSHRFSPVRFDLCISRFGTMFFTDPVAAFTNIGRAMRPGARLVLLVWQDADRNEWFTAIRQALAGSTPPAPTDSDLEPFSLADPTHTRRILTAAGFADVGFTAVHEPVYYGPDPDAAHDAVLGLRHACDLLASLDPATTEEAADRLRATLVAHHAGSGVLFESRAWIITGRRT